MAEIPRDGTPMDEYFHDMREVLEHECAQRNKAIDCHQLGEFYMSLDRNYAAAAEIFERLCREQDHASSCFDLGMLNLNGRGMEKGKVDVPEALRLFDKACGGGNAAGCNNAGLLYKSGKHGVPKDTKRAEKLFKSACDDYFPNGCFNLSALYLQGTPEVPQDKAQAFAYAKRACELGHLWGCVNAAHQSQAGDGVPVDLEAAARFRAKANDINLNRGSQTTE
eukprot:m.73112 g.73112  ORF g.73112 m.73112 type:complete len:223 (+) comp8024_c0_seq1:715-1383(+)